MPATAPDFAPQRTADGSLTLRSAQLGEQYHSVHGAVQESTHVFIKMGLEHVLATRTADALPQVDVLEVGLGTGLNLLLTWVRCLEGKCAVRYTALEPFPLQPAQLETLAHCEDLAWPGLHAPFLERMTIPNAGFWEPLGQLHFRLLRHAVQQFSEEAVADVVYFDAFGPPTQPEMWSLEVFQRMHRALRSGGVLVTYCAKGEVRRTLLAAGFTVERLQGPPGKREMLRATRGNTTQR